MTGCAKSPESMIMVSGYGFRTCRFAAIRNDKQVRSKPAHNLLHVFDLRRGGKAMADELAPFLKIGRAAKVDIVVLDRLPGDEQPVAAPLRGATVRRRWGGHLLGR